MKQKGTQARILLSSASYMFFTMLSRISGFIREILVAKYLGVSIESDAFFAAWRVPNSFRKLLADGGMSAAFVPLFVKIRTKSIELSNIFSFNIAIIMFIITCTVTILIEIFAPSILRIIAPGFLNQKEKMDLTILLLKIMMPYLPLISIVALLGGILNGVRVFSYLAGIQIIQNLSMMGSLMLFGKSENLIYYLSFSATVGGIVQTVIMIIGCKIHRVVPTISYKIISEIKDFFKNLLPVLVGQGAMQINIFVGTIFATATHGATSYLAYTDRIALFATTMIGFTLGTISLPLISKKIAINDRIGAKKIQEQCINFSTLLSIPTAIAMIFLSEEIVTSIYASKKFGNEHIYIVAKMLTIYAIAIPFISINRILNTSFFAHMDTKTPMRIGIISSISNILLNIILIKYIGFYAMILSTTICSIIETILSSFFLCFKYSFFDFSFKNIKILLITTIFGLIITKETSWIFTKLSVILPNLLSLVVAVIISVVSYIIIILVTKTISIEELKDN